MYDDVTLYLGKSGAVHGAVHDATPFKFGEEKGHDVDAIDFFARQLETAGYNYYGTETLYSGTDGVPMKASVHKMFCDFSERVRTVEWPICTHMYKKVEG